MPETSLVRRPFASPAHHLGYSPVDLANWPNTKPQTTEAAIDELADRTTTLEGSSGGGGGGYAAAMLLMGG